MPKGTRVEGMSMDDVLRVLRDTEEYFGVKVRLSVVPRPGTGYSGGCIALATCYHSNGKRMAEVEAEQALWPSTHHRTLYGLWVYLVTRLHAPLDEWAARRRREAEASPQAALTPLEEYIAGRM